MAGILIGELAERAGVQSPTIRYYERIGLLKSPARSEAGYRRYAEDTLAELAFIRKAQALGVSLEEIAEILTLTRAGKTPCDRVLSLAHQHLAAVDQRIEQLQGFREQLAGQIEKWDGKTGPTCDGLCQIIAMSDVRMSSPEGLTRMTTPPSSRLKPAPTTAANRPRRS